MLEEYIYGNLKEINQELKKIDEQYNKNKSEQDILKMEIRKIQEESDIDFEIFSPRNSGNVYKNKVSTMSEKLRLIKIENDKLDEKKIVYSDKKKLFEALKEDYEKLGLTLESSDGTRTYPKSNETVKELVFLWSQFAVNLVTPNSFMAKSLTAAAASKA